MTGERVPKGALSSDTSGERKRPIMGGVGMGKADGIGERDACLLYTSDAADE